MFWLSSLWRNLVHRDRTERDLDDEVRGTLDLLIAEKTEAGMTEEEASRAAAIELGGVEQIKEQVRDTRAGALLDGCLLDLRYGVRTLVKRPGFTAVAVATIAVGIGATTTVFTCVNALLIRGLPVNDPEQIVTMAGRNTASGQELFLSYPDFDDWRHAAASFSDVGAFNILARAMNVSDEERPPERADGYWITANAFRLLGQRPLIGRDFAPSDDHKEADPVVMLGYSLWKSRYGGDPSVLGRTITINERSATIIGVMPEGMKFPYNANLWLPLVPSSAQAPERRDARVLWVFARLKPDVSLAQARLELGAIAERSARQYPDTHRGLGASVTRFTARLVTPPMKLAFLTLMGAVGFVLLMACANVANLLLARSVQRVREIAVRLALGATRGRIIRQLLLESLVLSLMGGALGLLYSSAGLRLMARVTTDAGFPYFVRFTMDGRVFAFFAVVCVGTSVLFGLAPALQVSRPNVDQALRDASRTTTGGVPARRFSSAMVVAEVALAMILLTGAGLLIRSFVALYTIDLGMDTTQLLTMRVDLPTLKYPSAPERIAFYRQLLERLTATPGVEAATIASRLPLGEGQASRGLAIEGPVSAAGEPLPIVMVVTVGSSYFQTCDIDIRRGRAFRETDGAPGADHVIVNERLVARLFQNRDPIGQRIQLRTGPEGTAPWQTIVGVSRTVRQNGTFGEPDAVVYVPYQQDPAPAMTVIVRSRTPPAALIPTLRELVRVLDPNLAVFNIATMDQALAEARRFPGLFAGLFGIFALIALGLSAVGLYAITAYMVSQRTQEIGLRMALGATARQVRWLVLRRSLVQLAISLTIGVGGALALSRLLILAQVSAADPVTFVSVAAVFAAVSAVAALAGANPATRLDPVVAS